MTTRHKVDSRPFGQSKYPLSLIRPTLEGYHYKFEILVPISSRIIAPKLKPEKTVFGEHDLGELSRLFYNDFHGATYSSKDVNHPLLQGRWINDAGETVINKHVLYEVLTKRDEKVIEYFKELKERLQLYGKQKVLVIEQTEVTIIPPMTNLDQLARKVKRLEKEIKLTKELQELLRNLGNGSSKRF